MRCETVHAQSHNYVRSSHTLLGLDEAYRENVALCVSVFVGIHQCLHSFLCMCVSELSQDQFLVLLCLQSAFLSHLIAFGKKELSQVGTILKRQKTTRFKTCKLANTQVHGSDTLIRVSCTDWITQKQKMIKPLLSKFGQTEFMISPTLNDWCTHGRQTLQHEVFFYRTRRIKTDGLMCNQQQIYTYRQEDTKWWCNNCYVKPLSQVHWNHVQTLSEEAVYENAMSGSIWPDIIQTSPCRIPNTKSM